MSDEGPFLPEERRLIETLAEMLRMHFDALEAEAARTRAVRTQAAILDSLPAQIVLLGRDGVILAVNRAWKAFVAANGGGEETCGVGCSYLSLCEQPERGFPVSRRAARRIPDVLARRTDRLERDYCCRVQGQKRWYRLIAAPVHDGTDQGGAVVMHLNITAERRAERALRRSEEKYRTLIEAARDAVFYISPDAKFTALNAAFEEITGWPREQWLGRRFTDLLHPDDVSLVVPHFERALQGERPPLLEFRVRFKSGAYGVVECIGTPQARQGRIVGLLGIGRDITQRRHLEEQFRQAQKMEAVGRLAGGVAHDFNNMLTIINGYCELLLAQLPQEDPLRELITPIHDAGQRSSRLTRQLLTLSRRQILQPRAADLSENVRSVSTMLRRLLGEDVELVTASDQTLWLVEVDPGQFEQILLNLAVNARDAMPQGGKLTITTHNVKLDPARAASHSSLPAGEYVLLTVADTGSGMDAETLTHVFEPFFTTKERGKGTGLGLATVYGIVQQSNGHIEVDSEPDGGTLFRIYFPRIAVTDPADRADAPQPRAGGGTETILLVEDEPAIRQLFVVALTRAGYRVYEARNGQDAIRMFDQHGDAIDLLLTDMRMPYMGGAELAVHLRGRRRTLKLICISGYPGTLDPDLTLDCLAKPFSRDELLRKVREVLDRM
jgi:PAS domain S-box-containing protein